MYTEGIALVTVVLFVAICVAGFVTWGLAVAYMLKMIANYHPKRVWGKLLPISFFIPWFFTEEGNKYRIKFLKAVGLFVFLVLSGFGVGFLNESSRPERESMHAPGAQ